MTAATDASESTPLSQFLLLKSALTSSLMPSMIWRPVGAYPVLVDQAYPQAAIAVRYTAVCTLQKRHLTPLQPLGLLGAASFPPSAWHMPRGARSRLPGCRRHEAIRDLWPPQSGAYPEHHVTTCAAAPFARSVRLAAAHAARPRLSLL